MGITMVGLVGIAVVFGSQEVKKTIAMAEQRSSIASSHPEAIDLARSQKEIEELKPQLTPKWLDPNERNYTMFTSDAQVNVWWSGLFEMPLTRGYLDPPIGTGVAGNHFLLDQAVGGDGLVENFKYDPEVAHQMALYYIDWYAVKYLEGGRLSQSPNKPPSSYLKDEIDKEEQVEAKGAYMLYQTKSGKPEVWEDVPQYLKYFKFKDELVSPILSVNNSPVVLCACDWSAYESLTKVLAMNNLNSNYLMTVYWPGKIEELSQKELAGFDLVILANYKYGNRDKAFGELSEYLKNGGKALVDTGGEVPESKGGNLPEPLPFASAEREGLGKIWELEVKDPGLTENVDMEKFSPPTYNADEWSFSHPSQGLRQGAEVLVTQKGQPILTRAQVGQGKVIWSGMNLAYHVQVNTNAEESKLYVNLLKQLIELEDHKWEPGRPKFVSDRVVEFGVDNLGKGVMFKNQFWDGWVVKVNGKRVKAYAAGPTYPGFVYVPLLSHQSSAISGQPLMVRFEYWGQWWWYVTWLLTWAAGLVLVDLIVSKGWVVGGRVTRGVKKLGKWVGGWWEKETE